MDKIDSPPEQSLEDPGAVEKEQLNLTLIGRLASIKATYARHAEQLQAQIADVTAQLDFVVQQLQELGKYRSKVFALEEKLKQAQQDLGEARDQQGLIKRQAQIKINSLQKKLDQQNEELSSYRNENETLQTRLAQFDTDLTALRLTRTVQFTSFLGKRFSAPERGEKNQNGHSPVSPATRVWAPVAQILHKDRRPSLSRGAGNNGVSPHLTPSGEKSIGGALDAPVPGQRINSLQLEIRGWAYSPASAITAVEVRLGGRELGRIEYGTEQPDLAGATEGLRPVKDCGFQGVVGLEGAFIYGEQLLEVEVQGSANQAKIFTCGIFIEEPVIQGVLDSPPPGAPVLGNLIEIAGWAFSTTSKVKRVEVFVGGLSLGTIPYGKSRPDVANVFRGLDVAKSGFSGIVGLPGGLAGAKVLRVCVTDLAGNSFDFLHKIILEEQSIKLVLDHPRNGAVSSGRVEVGGWAFSEKASIVQVEVFLGNKLLGLLKPGISRPDVYQLHGHPNAKNSGFWGIVNFEPEEDISEPLVVRAVNSAGNSASAVVEIEIKLASQPRAEIRSANWSGNVLEIEGWALWPKSRAPRLAQLHFDDVPIAQSRVNLSQPELLNRYPGDPHAFNAGWRFYQLISPDLLKNSGRHKITLEFSEGGGTFFQKEMVIAAPASSPPLMHNFTWASVLTEFEERTGKLPSILDWNTGLNLTACLNNHPVFLPPAFIKDTCLPYLDGSIDIVVVRENHKQRTQTAVEEASRVASGAVIQLNQTGLNGAGPANFKVIWKQSLLEVNKLPGVSIIIPHYNGSHLIAGCLEQLVATLPGWIEAEILVMDDATTDNSQEVIALWAEIDRRIRPVRNRENLGFLKTCNLAASLARNEILVFLNNDTLPQPGWLPPLLKVLRDKQAAGAVGGKLLFPNGALQEAGGVIFSDGEGWNFGRGTFSVDAPLFNYVREVDYCSGALFATPRALFNSLGGFDPVYSPMYYEDVDYCFALRDRGYKVYYQPESAVIHIEGATAGTDPATGFKAYQLVNLEKFRARWAAALSRQPEHPKGAGEKELLALAVRDKREPGSAASGSQDKSSFKNEN